MEVNIVIYKWGLPVFLSGKIDLKHDYNGVQLLHQMPHIFHELYSFWFCNNYCQNFPSHFLTLEFTKNCNQNVKQLVHAPGIRLFADQFYF